MGHMISADAKHLAQLYASAVDRGVDPAMLRGFLIGYHVGAVEATHSQVVPMEQILAEACAAGAYTSICGVNTVLNAQTDPPPV